MRRLTVSKLVQTSGLLHRRRTTRTAQLRLAGRWFERAGFTAGSRVAVAIAQGQLVITADLKAV